MRALTQCGSMVIPLLLSLLGQAEIRDGYSLLFGPTQVMPLHVIYMFR